MDPTMVVGLGGGLGLRLGSGEAAASAATRGLAGSGSAYPTDRIPKAMTIEAAGLPLSEEGVGFGLPVVKRARETIFPSSFRVLDIASDLSRFSVKFEMDLVARLAPRSSSEGISRGLLGMRAFYALKAMVSAVHRQLPFTRGAITLMSGAILRVFGLKTVFARAASLGSVRVDYVIDAPSGIVSVKADLRDLDGEGLRETVFMNEGGARFFSRYRDSSGVALEGDSIETWNPVEADRAAFICPSRGVFFEAERAPGARLFRGRELEEGRLSWSGFGFALPASARAFEYRLRVGVEA